jgi:CheY-like chemotaxis protein
MTPNENSKHKVLVVDDDAAVRESLTMLLTAEGYEVSSAENGFDALLQLKTSTPDVITSDLNMPQMSGFEFLSVARRRFPHMPVIAISGALIVRKRFLAV